MLNSQAPGTVLQVSNLTSKDGRFSLLQKETSFHFSAEKCVLVDRGGSLTRGPGLQGLTRAPAVALTCLRSHKETVGGLSSSTKDGV